MDELVSAGEVRWYGHVLRRDNGDVSRRALDFEVAGRREYERPNTIWRSISMIGLKRENVIGRVKRHNGAYKLSRSLR